MTGRRNDHDSNVKVPRYPNYLKSGSKASVLAFITTVVNDPYKFKEKSVAPSATVTKEQHEKFGSIGKLTSEISAGKTVAPIEDIEDLTRMVQPIHQNAYEDDNVDAYNGPGIY